ncbi:ABC transporter ATP-binding protein [Fodinicola acaciae]|uniref:ABC transporter ATP-binding protein n=1 Tax=Fodinicola acaciae TaxID=2681555 RepID=UPI001FE5B617|nr:ATP-binding cassette domain-containing protein [Fodinicola acaciae]
MDATAKPAIRLDNVSKQYPDGTVAVASLTIDIPEGELVAFIGPSGCGKSTTLRMINRLTEPTGGQLWLADEDVTRVDPVRLRRRIGYVIQQVGLFPHQDVRTNVGTVPRLLGWDGKRIRERTDELLDLVGLDPAVFGKRYPHELSGGQRQRVGVARALAADPVVLLMDEPFSAIDPIARGRLQEEFLRLQAEVRKTIVMVTHDVDEAVRMADRIAVFSEGGKLEQYADPATILGAPSSSFVADFVGGDRSLRRLAVTPIDVNALAPLSAVTKVDDVPSVTVNASLKDALAVLLAGDTGWVAVRDGSTTLGVLSPQALHQTLRHALPPEAATADD